MSEVPLPSGAAERFARATLDHHMARLNYAAAPDSRPTSGGWRCVYLHGGGTGAVSAVGPAGGGWCSLGIEIPARRAVASARAEHLLLALAPYEVALDLDASEGRPGRDVVVRVALRVFVEGLAVAVVRDVLDNVAEAADVARRLLDAE